MSFDFLEDFGAPIQQTPAEPQSEQSDPMQGYETGFQAGWDDAIASVAQERDHISADFARNLQELSFTFHEAREQVTASLRPLISTMLDQLLPLAAQQSLAEHVWAVLEPILVENNSPQVNLLCAPDDVETIEGLAQNNATLDINVNPEPSLHAGQVRFKLQAEQHQIDTAALATQINDLFSSSSQSQPSNLTQEVQYAG